MSVFKRKKRFHFVGIGGIGMSGLAEILLSMGHWVSGSDRQLSDITEYLAQRGAVIYQGHRAENVQKVDFLIYSSAIPRNNPEMVRARELGIPCMRRAELLGQIFNRHFGIAVAGTHGKTTTTAMIGHIMLQANLDPTIVVGGRLHNLMTNARLGKSAYLVAEADEYDRSFLTLFPRLAVLTSLEVDHLDIYKDLEDLKRTFLKFTDQVTFDGAIICCNEAPNLRQILPLFKNMTLTYGLNSQADFWAANISYAQNTTRFDVFAAQKKLGTIELNVPGEHNVLNALAAVVVARELEIDFGTIAEALKTFTGVERRFDVNGVVDDIIIVNDYAHHPTEIEVTLKAAKNGWERRLIAVFQPHLFSRTRDFYKEFARVLQLADLAAIMGIYPAREAPIPGVSGKLIADALGEKGYYLPEEEALFEFLENEIKSGDMVLFLGAGSVNQTAQKFVERLKKGKAHG